MSVTNTTTYIEKIISQFPTIATDRRLLLTEMATYISSGCNEGKPVNLVFICTHNSRRSHFGQIWAQVAAAHFGLKGVNTFSGGTEATAFHPNAVAAVRRAGLMVEQMGETNNPKYRITDTATDTILPVWSKLFDDSSNPGKDFAAIMTCSSADEACPIIPGAATRIALTFEDPKVSDGTPQESTVYDLRCLQIATEIFYAFRLAQTSVS